MPRTARASIGGVAYHVLNRGNGKAAIFRKPEDYAAFVELLIAGRERARVDLFGYCLMPNHWHLVLRPKGDGDMAAYLSWVTNTHVKRYRSQYPGTSGHLYQGRYKSFAVEEDEYFLTLMRYVEANPRRAKLVKRAQEWRWSSLGCGKPIAKELLSPWPVDRLPNWSALVNEEIPRDAKARLQSSFDRGSPLGSAAWVKRMAKRLGVEYTLNPRGRPKKTQEKE
jgi:putative transposase